MMPVGNAITMMHRPTGLQRPSDKAIRMNAKDRAERDGRIRALRADGMSISQIQAQTGFSHGTVQRAVEKLRDTEPDATADPGQIESNGQSVSPVAPSEAPEFKSAMTNTTPVVV